MAIDIITIRPRTISTSHGHIELIDLDLQGTAGEDITICFSAEEFAIFAEKVSAVALETADG